MQNDLQNSDWKTFSTLGGGGVRSAHCSYPWVLVPKVRAKNGTQCKNVTCPWSAESDNEITILLFLSSLSCSLSPSFVLWTWYRNASSRWSMETTCLPRLQKCSRKAIWFGYSVGYTSTLSSACLSTWCWVSSLPWLQIPMKQWRYLWTAFAVVAWKEPTLRKQHN